MRCLTIFTLCATLLLGESINVSLITPDDMKTIFKTFEIVPYIIQVPPPLFLNVVFDDDKVLIGNIIYHKNVKKTPLVKWPEADPTSFYTLIAIDPESPPREGFVSEKWISWASAYLNDTDLKKANHHTKNIDETTEFIQWLVVNIPGMNIEKGNTLVEYVGTEPIHSLGFHRHIFLVFKQPKKLTFDESHISDKLIKERKNFTTAIFVKKYNLGNPIAGNFFVAENKEKKHKKLSRSYQDY